MPSDLSDAGSSCCGHGDRSAWAPPRVFGDRMGDMSKRKTETAYIKYLNQSIQRAQKVGGTNYWDYNYHRKTREAVR